jgi:hypothetical protein
MNFDVLMLHFWLRVFPCLRLNAWIISLHLMFLLALHHCRNPKRLFSLLFIPCFLLFLNNHLYVNLELLSI